MVTVPPFRSFPKDKGWVYKSLRGGCREQFMRMVSWLRSSWRSQDDPDILSKGAEMLLCPWIQVPSEFPGNSCAEGSVDPQVDDDGISITPEAATSAQLPYLTLLQKICGENLSTGPRPGNDLPAVQGMGLKLSDHILRDKTCLSSITFLSLSFSLSLSLSLSLHWEARKII